MATLPQGFEIERQPVMLPEGFEIEQPEANQDDTTRQLSSSIGNGADDGVSETIKNSALEFMSGVNRGVATMADMPAELANAVLQLSGADMRVPKLKDSEIMQSGIGGGFLPPGPARQVMGTAGEFAAPGLPLGAIAKGRKGLSAADEFAQSFVTQGPAKQAIAKKITADPASKSIVKYAKDGAGRVAKDKEALGAIKQGFDKGVVAVVKGATSKDRSKMAEMVKILKKGRDNALYKAKVRPSDVAGRSLVERVNHIKAANKTAGKAVERSAQSLRGKAVDYKPAMDKFIQDLSDMGVKLDTDDAGVMRPLFKGSDIEGLSGPQGIVKNMVNRLSDTKTPDAYDVHRMKKFIDENVTFGKAVKGLGGKTERVFKDLRRGLDSTLDLEFADYEKANRVYSETIGVLDDLQSAVGTKLDFTGPNVDKAFGTSLRRLLSNTQSRANLVSAIDDIESIAKKTGATFDDDIMSQVLFSDELDSMFGAAARTSLKGQAEQAVAKGADIAGGRGLFASSVDVAGNIVEKARGINEENAIQAMETLLKRGYK